MARASGQARVFTTGTPSELALARTIGLEYLTAWARAEGIGDELRVTTASVDATSTAHTRVQQYFKGIPVFGGEAIAHIRPTGEPFGVTDTLLRTVKVDTTPRVTAAAAVAEALREAGSPPSAPAPPAPGLFVLRLADVDHLVFRVELRMPAAGPPSLPVLFVDAHTGVIVSRYDNLQTGVLR